MREFIICFCGLFITFAPALVCIALIPTKEEQQMFEWYLELLEESNELQAIQEILEYVEE